MNENFTDDDSSLLYLLPNNPPLTLSNSLKRPTSTLANHKDRIPCSAASASTVVLLCPVVSSLSSPHLSSVGVLSSSRIYYLIILKILSIIILHTTTMRERGAATDTPYSSSRLCYSSLDRTSDLGGHLGLWLCHGLCLLGGRVQLCLLLGRSIIGLHDSRLLCGVSTGRNRFPLQGLGCHCRGRTNDNISISNPVSFNSNHTQSLQFRIKCLPVESPLVSAATTSAAASVVSSLAASSEVVVVGAGAESVSVVAPFSLTSSSDEPFVVVVSVAASSVSATLGASHSSTSFSMTGVSLQGEGVKCRNG